MTADLATLDRLLSRTRARLRKVANRGAADMLESMSDAAQLRATRKAARLRKVRARLERDIEAMMEGA